MSNNPQNDSQQGYDNFLKTKRLMRFAFGASVIVGFVLILLIIFLLK
jgi:hypothetical protein